MDSSMDISTDREPGTLPGAVPMDGDNFSTPARPMKITSGSATITRSTATFPNRGFVVGGDNVDPDTSVTSERGGAAEANLNGTFEVAKTASPKMQVKPQQRQKTMVVESPHVTAIREAFANVKATVGQDGPVDQLANLERVVMNTFQRYDTDVNARHLKAVRQKDFELRGFNSFAEERCKLIDDLMSRVASGGSGNAMQNSMMVTPELEKLKADFERQRSELCHMSQEYAKLSEMYAKQNGVIQMQRDEYKTLFDSAMKEREEYKELKVKHRRLRQNADETLARASRDLEAKEAQHESDTKGLRQKVKFLQSRLDRAERELEIKRQDVSDLREMCDTLMKTVEQSSDQESHIDSDFDGSMQ